MKKIIICALAIMMASASVETLAEVVRNGNTFSKVTEGKAKAEPTATTYKYKVGETDYPIYLSKNGRAFIVRTSQKTGKEYKQYLGEEISRTICKELGVEYKELKK